MYAGTPPTGILVVNQSEVRGGVDGEVTVRGGGFGTEHPDGILVVNEVVDDKPVGAVPFHHGVAQAGAAVAAVGVGYELADSDCHRARGPVARPGAVLIDNGAVFAERIHFFCDIRIFLSRTRLVQPPALPKCQSKCQSGWLARMLLLFQSERKEQKEYDNKQILMVLIVLIEIN